MIPPVRPEPVEGSAPVHPEPVEGRQAQPERGFIWPVRVYWEDTDAGGIVFYANYLKFFERARTEWLRSLGIEQQQLKNQTGGMFVVVETSVKYLRPARLDDELIVTARLQESGRASMTIAQQAVLKNTLLCEGTIRIGWVDSASMQPARIPQNIIESLRKPT
ncbi:MAG: tol-pal system-associated acyl-CoA thioesterase [Polaromonas sp.]